MIFDTPPAIIQRAEPWELDLDRKLSSLRLPRHVRRAITAEMRKLEGSDDKIIKPAIADLARYGKDPMLASFLVPPLGWGVAPPATVAYINSATATSGNPVNLTISGNVTAQRCVCGVWLRGGGSSYTLNSVTLAGQATSSIIAATGGIGVNANRHLLILITTAAISFTTSTTMSISLSAANATSIVGAVWAITAVSYAAFSTASDPTADPSVLDLDCPAGGIVVGIAGTEGTTTYDWSASDSPFAENYDRQANSRTSSGASGAFNGAGTKVIRADAAAPSTTRYGCAAAWR